MIAPIQVSEVQVTNSTKWIQPEKTFCVDVTLQPASEENGPLRLINIQSKFGNVFFNLDTTMA